MRLKRGSGGDEDEEEPYIQDLDEVKEDEDSDKLTFEKYEEIIASTDHKPDLGVERKRIKAAGGFVQGGAPDPDADGDEPPARSFMGGDCARLDGNLAVSRGFADYQYKDNSALE